MRKMNLRLRSGASPVRTGTGAGAATATARSDAGIASTWLSKSVIVCGLPLSVRTKSDRARSRAGFPSGPVTKTWMSFRVTVTSCWRGAWSAPAATRKKMTKRTVNERECAPPRRPRAMPTSGCDYYGTGPALCQIRPFPSAPASAKMTSLHSRKRTSCHHPSSSPPAPQGSLRPCSSPSFPSVWPPRTSASTSPARGPRPWAGPSRPGPTTPRPFSPIRPAWPSRADSASRPTSPSPIARRPPPGPTPATAIGRSLPSSPAAPACPGSRSGT